MSDEERREGAGVELLIVMPARNEEAAIGRVVREWWTEVNRHTSSFRFLVLDDGSTDGTPTVLNVLRGELGPRLVVERGRYGGHGQACLAGYRRAAQTGARHVLQIDSDGQCDPQYFAALWSLRGEAVVVYGRRVHRDDGFGRAVVSSVLRLVVRVFTGARCTDPNVPYRLMRTRVIEPFASGIPAEFDLANVGLAVRLARAGVPERSVPIGFRKRYGGTPSLRPLGFLSKALRLAKDLAAQEQRESLVSDARGETLP